MLCARGGASAIFAPFDVVCRRHAMSAAMTYAMPRVDTIRDDVTLLPEIAQAQL